MEEQLTATMESVGKYGTSTGSVTSRGPGNSQEADDLHCAGENGGSDITTSGTTGPLSAGPPPPSLSGAAIPSSPSDARLTLINFCLMAVLFSANHAAVVACLSLATARLGSVGAWQSGVLYIAYTGSAIFGATYVVKTLGSRDALIAGMIFYTGYVGCFWVAAESVGRGEAFVHLVALSGAAVGGVGAGFLWTAQGSYFAKAAEEHSKQLCQPVSDSNSTFAGIFAFFYLIEEVALRSLSSILLQFGTMGWSRIFAIYALVAVTSSCLMIFVHRYPKDADGSMLATGGTASPSAWYKITAAWQLLRGDPKMKYMVGLNAVFGFAAAFLNSYVNGEVVGFVLEDGGSRYIGYLTAWLSLVAAAMSLVFGRVAPRIGKGPILIFGALCFFMVAFPFLVRPDLGTWSWLELVLIYTFHGTGRATFEGTLKATFADYFPNEKEGAFANIILQSGLSSAVGYILTFNLLCSRPSQYCVEYSDGTYHDVLSFEVLVLASSVLAVLGYLRASSIRSEQSSATQRQSRGVFEDTDAARDLLEDEFDDAA